MGLVVPFTERLCSLSLLGGKEGGGGGGGLGGGGGRGGRGKGEVYHVAAVAPE